ncbi:MAG: AAA family ATPase [Lachnospiraceae bacterium]|nr:AAA family ATPase [Lachnospiraceae bacterium]
MKVSPQDAPDSINRLCELLERHYGKKAIILLDEYDTPMQEAWISGYWDELVSFTRMLFNNTFKTNPHLGRAVMTGITRVNMEMIRPWKAGRIGTNKKECSCLSARSEKQIGADKESIFSDLNNLAVVAITSEKYRTSFGFTEEEVFAAVDAQGFDPALKKEVKFWYDGFTFGSATDITALSLV